MDLKPRSFHTTHTTHIEFFDMDAIDCCLTHAPNALVLNLADDVFPGGCVAMGSGAQEESLFRRTNYCCTLTSDMYPIKPNEAIYSPDVSVFKTSERTGWEMLDMDPLPKISFIACPAIKYPATIVMEGETRLNETDVDTLKRKIETILQTAIHFGHDTIIFGAMGCGAWRCPAKHVAQIFKEVLTEYDHCAQNYYFAIMNTTDDNYIVRDRSNNKGPVKTIDIFRDVFSQN